MKMMMKMTNNMLKQSQLFTEEIKKVNVDQNVDIQSRLGGGKIIGQTPAIRHLGAHAPPAATLIRSHQANLPTRAQTSYKPYQYPTRAVRPDFISNGTKKKTS